MKKVIFVQLVEVVVALATFFIARHICDFFSTNALYFALAFAFIIAPIAAAAINIFFTDLMSAQASAYAAYTACLAVAITAVIAVIGNVYVKSFIALVVLIALGIVLKTIEKTWFYKKITFSYLMEFVCIVGPISLTVFH